MGDLIRTSEPQNITGRWCDAYQRLGLSCQ
jgi:hypothetical protein